MKRIRNGSRDATMIRNQLFKRSNGGRIAQYDSHGAASASPLGLTLRTCFRFFHRLFARVTCVITAHRFCSRFSALTCRPARKRLSVNTYVKRAVSLFRNCDWRTNFPEPLDTFRFNAHDYLRSRAIRPMGKQYNVTSDVSRGIQL